MIIAVLVIVALVSVAELASQVVQRRGDIRRRSADAEAAAVAAREAEAAAALMAKEAEAAAARAARAARTWWDKKRRRQLMIHLLDETTIRGVVLEVAEDGVLLASAEYLGDKSVPLGGEVFIPRERIAFVQVPPRTA